MQLLSLHKRLRPRWMDLLHDMGESESFAIDGESLVLEAISFSRSESQVLGGQPVAAVYYAERLLEQLLERGGRFTILFYDAAAAVWRSRISAWATRQVLISHLTLLQQQITAASGSAAFDIVTMPYFWGRCWVQHLATLKPKFILVTDAFLDALQQHDAGTSSTTAASSSAASTPPAAAPVPVQLYEFLLLASFEYLVSGVDLVYLGQLQFDPLTALGFLVAAQKSYRYLQDHIDSMVADKRAIIAGIPFVSASNSSSISVSSSNGGLQESMLRQQLGSWRLAAAVNSCRTATCSSSSSCLKGLQTNQSSSMDFNHSNCSCAECWYAAVFLLHAVLLDILPLELRAQPAASASTIFKECSKLDRFTTQVLTAMGSCLQAAVSSSAGAGGAGTAVTGQTRHSQGSTNTTGSAEAGDEAGLGVPAADMSDLADPWDGHLLLWLLVQMATAADARKQLATSNSASWNLKPSDIIEGLGERGRQQFAAAISALAQVHLDKHSVVPTLAAVEALLINCVPLELRSWASRLPAGVAVLANGNAASTDAAAAAAAQGAQLLTKMKQRNSLLSQMFAQFKDSSPTSDPAPAAAGSCHLTGLVGAMSTVQKHSGGTAGDVATAEAESRVAQQPTSSSSVGPNSVSDVGGSTACAVVSGSLFGVGVFEEKYHWHVRRELEPAFLRESKDDYAHLQERKKFLRSLPPRVLAKWRGLPDDLREQLSDMLGEIDTNPAAAARIEAQVKERALKALEGALLRPLQVERRALERMVASLQGGTTFYRKPSSQQSASNTADSAAQSVQDNSSTTSSSSRGNKKQSGKKAAILADVAAKRRQEEEDKAATKWSAGDGPAQLTAAALQAADRLSNSSNSSRGGVDRISSLIQGCNQCDGAMAAVEGFKLRLSAGLLESGLSAQCYVAKLALHHAQLACLAAAATAAAVATAQSASSGTNSSVGCPVQVAAAAAAGNNTLSVLPEVLHNALQQLLLTVMAVSSCPTAVQHMVVSVPAAALTISSKHDRAAPIQAAAALLAAIGYSAVGDMLLKSSGFDSSTVVYQKTKKAFGFKQLPFAPQDSISTQQVHHRASLDPPTPTAAAVYPTPVQLDNADTASTVSGTSKSSRASKKASAGPDSTSSKPSTQVILPSWQRLQLSVLTHHLPRSEGAGGHDPRVTGFKPDDWQRKLLDVVDQGSSAVVCAPTSSGKTFISSYVIQQVLKPPATAAAAGKARQNSKGASNSSSSPGSISDGVVVIVLPTKALVNQLAAQVYNDFGPGIHGIFTRDYRVNAQSCRVLITVPACLEILVLSPSNRQWVESVQWVIFDEVHCISERGGGDIWERLLLAVRCPFLALSATVGNPVGFTDWLQKLKDAQLVADQASGLVTASNTSSSSSSSTRPASYAVHLIQHSERHNELVAQIYVPGCTAQRQQRQQLEDSAAASGANPVEDGSEGGLQSMPAQLSGTRHRGLQGPVWTLNNSGSSKRQSVGNSRSNGQAVVQQLVDHFSSTSASSSGGSNSSSVSQPPHGLIKLHPAASLSLEKLSVAAAAGGGWPPEMDMAPDEALQLFDALMAAVNQLHNITAPETADGHAAAMVSEDNGNAQHQVVTGLCEELNRLCPERCLGDGALHRHSSTAASHSNTVGLTGAATCQVFASKQSAKAWGRQLKDLTASWAQQGGSSRAAVQIALQRLSAAPAAAIAAAEASWQQQHPKEPAYDWPYQRDHLMQLILDLRHAGQLPAILFNFERGLCMKYASVICAELAAAERAWIEHNEDILQHERMKLEAASAGAVGDGDVGGSRGGARQQQLAASSSGGLDLRSVIIDGVVASVDEGAPHPSFTLLSYDKAKSTDLWDVISELRELGTDDELLDWLARGVGVHHSGLDTKYRHAVEMLFRSKHLQVVIATGTLAYGIHMPCRTVVMTGDSPFLDALNFRQMSGRAGRRGLDNMGHVVFYSLPKHRVDSLRVSKLPRLRGTLLPHPGLLLRMLLLHHQLDSRLQQLLGPEQQQLGSVSRTAIKPDVAKAATYLASATTSILKIASEPFLAAEDAAARAQLSHMADFGLAYLAASHLIDGSGRPVGLAGLVTHLFWQDPANFVFVRLLSSGVVHKLVQRCQGQGQAAQQLLHEALLLLLAGLFEQVPLHPLQVKRWQGRARAESPSVVVLPELPPDVSAVVQDNNKQVLQLLLQVLKQHMSAADANSSSNLQEHTLPLSGQRFGSNSLHRGDCAASGRLAQALTATAVPAVLASPFMALCGGGDSFSSLSELLLAGKRCLRLYPSCVPLLGMQDRHGRELRMNAYALDYFKHGQKSALVTANGLLEGDAWQHLHSIASVITAISLSVGAAVEADALADQSPDEAAANQQVAAALQSLSTAFWERFRGFNSNGVVYGAVSTGRGTKYSQKR